MKISEALTIATEEVGWSPTRVAAEVGVTEAAARRWLNGSASPRVEQFRELRHKLPRFAELIDQNGRVA